MTNKCTESPQNPVGFVEANLLALNAFGEENAVTLDHLTKYAGLSSKRHLQKLTERERENGAFILSSGKGMFLPDTDEEKGYRETVSCIRTWDRKAKSLLHISGVFRRKLQLPDQTQIGEDSET